MVTMTTNFMELSHPTQHKVSADRTHVAYETSLWNEFNKNTNEEIQKFKHVPNLERKRWRRIGL